jgi:hypothetical protein
MARDLMAPAALADRWTPLADDKIALLREYCETHLVRTVLFG